MTESPRQLAEKRITLSAEYSTLSETLSQILTFKAKKWIELRTDSKSASEADKKWEMSPAGIEEMKTRLRLKAIEKELSALRTMLSVLEGEARNLI